MKVGMLADEMRIRAPLKAAQSALDIRGWAWSAEELTAYALSHNLSEIAQQEKEMAYQNSNFERVYPTEGPEMALYDRVVKVASVLPMDFLPGIKLPPNVVRGGEA